MSTIYLRREKAERSLSQSLIRELMKSRTILVSQMIIPEATERVLAQLLVLEREDPDGPIKVFINSPGGSADDGFAIFDMLRFVSCPIKTISSGLTASAATIVLLATSKENRFALPNSRIMIHQPSVGVQGSASDIKITAEQVLKLRDRANRLIAEETGQPLKKVEEDTNRDYWLSPTEALEYGLIGRIATIHREV
ncbi:MAG: ATP-dependent Clp protease proteolytic subunit [Candidatus Latescibacteria bacterium]|nr:ATP-dependent Clp protease proteolytic subunit [Candidatus Latescibacterota bacterium]